jgi:para-aminobenzoate synthetase/4-amino-4-deoxychorismate lyase
VSDSKLDPGRRVDFRRALIRDAAQGRWLSFENPVSVLVAETAAQVRPVLEDVEVAAAAGRWVVGYVGYEAASAFDDALPGREGGEHPLAVFAVFDLAEEVEEPRPPGPQDTAGAGAGRGQRSDVTVRQYGEAIESIRDAIREGDTYQVNYTYRLTRTVEEAPFDLFRRLLHAQAATYAAFLDLGDTVLASASPELFFQREGQKLTSRPMKGTLGRRVKGQDDPGHQNEDPGVNALATSQKDRAENLMIVDMVRNDLSRICRPGSVMVPSLWTLESYPTVWQMTSTVEGQSDASLPDIFGALFPPASITGAPKKAAMEIIQDLERSPRGCYTGTIGFVAPGGDAQFNVAIRTAVIEPAQGQLTYGVGGGIIWDSRAESEYEETLAKAAILDFAWPEFRLLETLRWTPHEGFLLLSRHLDRMESGARFFGFEFSRGTALEALRAAAVRWPAENRRCRLTVGSAGDPVVVSETLPELGASYSPRLALAPACVPSADAFLRYKTTHRAVYAGLKDACPGCDDVLLWNERGEVTESCIANVFFWKDCRWWTPPADAGLLPGTLRAELLERGRVSLAILRVEELTAGVPIFLGNSVRGAYRPSQFVSGTTRLPLPWGGDLERDHKKLFEGILPARG